MSHVEMLPPGVHPMTLDHVEELFVESAPFEGDRREIWDVFEVYTDLLSEHLPGTRLVIDGDFTMWNPKKPPRDIDFVAMLDIFRLVTLPDDVARRLKQVRATSDVLDAHLIPDWDHTVESWIIDRFSEVRDDDRRLVYGDDGHRLRKGVISVSL